MTAPSKKSFGYAIHHVARQLRRRFDASARHHGLTLSQWRIIAQLAHEDGLSQAALATSTETDAMTVSGLVERLEAKGLVQRDSDPSDSRAKIVNITPKARAMVSEVKALAELVYAEAFAGVSAADRATTLAVLLRVNANLSSQPMPVKEETT